MVADGSAPEAGWRVVRVDASATYDLRWRVLRASRPGADVSFPEDAAPGAVHLGVAAAEEDALVAVGSFSPQPTPHRPRANAVRLRGLAVAPRFQQAGVGRFLLDVAAARFKADGFELLWANGRDGVLGFYRRSGWRVQGVGFHIGEVPHHVVLLDL